MCSVITFLFYLVIVLYKDTYAKQNELTIKQFNWNADQNNNMWAVIDEVLDIKPGKPLKIILMNIYIKNFRCWNHYYGSIYIEKVSNDDNKYVAQVDEIQDEMSDMWKCRITDGNINDIYFEIRVSGAKPTQMVLVNNIVLPTQRKSFSDPYAEPKMHFAMYYYEEDDEVDVACVNPENQKCTLYLEYGYADAIDAISESISSTTRVGFRTKLQGKHNNSNMFCRCKCSKDSLNTDVLVTFILKKKTIDNIQLKINDVKVSGVQVNNNAPNKMSECNYKHGLNKMTECKYYKYAYFNTKDDISIRCDSAGPSIELETLCDVCESINYYQSGTSISKKILPTNETQYKKIEIRAKNIPKPWNEITEVIEIGFIALNEELIRQDMLKITGLPPENIAMEIYGNKGTQLIYYEYNDDEDLSLECSKINDDTDYYLEFSGESKRNPGGLTQIIKLDKSMDNMKINCTLKERRRLHSNKVKIKAEIYILFQMKETKYIGPNPKTAEASKTTTVTTTTTTLPTTATAPTTTTAPTTMTPLNIASTPTSLSATTPAIITNDTYQEPEKKDWIPVAVGILMAIILIGVCLTLYKMRQRKRLLQRGLDTTYENLCSDNGPAIPSYPEQWENNYAVPTNQIINNTCGPTDALYAKPTPKNLRQNKKSETVYTNQSQINALNKGKEDTEAKTYDTDLLYATPLSCNSNTIYANQQLANNTTAGTDSTIKEVYSQVLPKSLRNNKTYANVSKDKIKDNECDYAEPAYGQLLFK